MEGLWIIIIIVALVYRALSKVGEISGEMKNRLPEGEDKRYPPVIKDWGFPWEEDDEWGGEGEYYTEPREKRVQSSQNTAGNASVESPRENATGIPDEITEAGSKESAMELPAYLQQENGVAGIEKQPLLDYAGLINGLILSELLQPPKSRRLRRRF